MPEKGIRSTYSQCPLQILMYDDDGLISTGSAFFYEFNGSWFLITNWHNFSGRHFITKEPLGRSNRFPRFIKVRFSTYIDTESDSFPKCFSILPQKIDIYENFEPLWREHPDLGSGCDIVALQLKRPDSCPDFMHNAANRISKIRIPVKPGATAFIIGFPRSLSVGFGLPLWKAGYIASEPHYDVTVGGKFSEAGGLIGGQVLPAFFIDSQTREGMSGSPVFAAYMGNWDTSDPYRTLNPDDPNFWSRDDIALGENRMEFVGCYSGRVGPLEEGVAFGLCWREDAIMAVCGNTNSTTHPHIINNGA